MDTSNERPNQGAHGAVGEITMESGDWRSHLQRQRIMNKILDILKKHLPFSGYDRQQELKKIAERVEEEIYTAATNQSEYSRKICFNMLSIETRLQNPMSGPSIPQTDNLNSGDWQEEVYQKIKALTKLYELESSDWRAGLKAESRQRVLNKMIKSCHHPSLRPEELQELKKKTVRFEEKTYNAATSQAEYLRKISLKMLKMENSLKYPMLSNSTADSDNPLDPGSQVMQQVNNQGQRFSIPVASNKFQQMSQSMNTNIGSIGMGGSSSLLSGLPPGSGLQQRLMANVAGQNSNLLNIQNMSSVQQNMSGLPPGSGLQQRLMANVAGQNSNLLNIQNMSSVQQNTVGNIMGYNNFANQRQIPGRQQLIRQQLPQQQPQTQNSHYLYRQHLQQMAKQAHIQQQQQMRSHMMHNKIGSTGMQGSSSLSSAILPGSSLQQPMQQQMLQQPMPPQPMLQQQKLQQPMLQQQILQQPMLQQQRNVVQQNQQRLKPTEGASGTVADPTIGSGDWRDQLSADSRERIQKKIMDTLRRHLPSFGEQELNKFAKRIEEGFYAVATSQSDYLRKISLKMLTIQNNSLTHV